MLESRRNIALACVLSALAGYVDGIGFLHLGGLFVSRKELEKNLNFRVARFGGVNDPLSLPSTAPSFGTQTATPAGPAVHHEVNLEQNIYETTNARLTASEVVRRARSAEFLGGGRLPAGSFP